MTQAEERGFAVEPAPRGIPKPEPPPKLALPKPQQPVVPAVVRAERESRQLADRVLVAADRARSIFQGSTTEQSVTQMPDTTWWTAGVQNDAVLTAITSEAATFFATIYGGEDQAAFLSAELFEDPLVRERTYAALAVMRDRRNFIDLGGGVSRASGPAGSGGAAWTSPANPVQQPTRAELLERIMDNPAEWDNLGFPEQSRIQGIADELLSSLDEMPDTGLTESLHRAIAIGSSGDVTMALSQEQIDLLETLRGRFETRLPFSSSETGHLGGTTQETPELRRIGIEQVRQLDAGVIVLNDEWAKARPDEAYAIQIWLEQNMPELDIQFGRQGIVGSLLDKLGLPIDYLTAPIGAAVLQIDEGVERLTTSPDDRRRMMEKADDLEHRLQIGDVPEEQVERTMRDIAQLRDEGTVELGWDQFVDDMERNTRPRVTGFGFADSYMRAMELVPGDPGYGAAYAFIGLASNIVADPLMWGPNLVGGLNAARNIPKLRFTAEMRRALGTAEDIASRLRMGNPSLSASQALRAGERVLREAERTGELVPIVGNSWVRNAVYRHSAEFPEQIVVSRPWMQASDVLWTARQRLGERQFGSAMSVYFGDTPNIGGGVEAGRSLAQATSREDMALTMLSTQLGMGQDVPNAARLRSQLDQINAQLARESQLPRVIDEARVGTGALAAEDIPQIGVLENELQMLRAGHTDLVARRAHLVDLLDGRDWVRPMRSLFTPKNLRQIRRLSKAGPDRRTALIEAAAESADNVPANVLRGTTEELNQFIAQNPRAERASRTLLQRWHDAWRDPGAGQLLVFPHTSQEASALRSGAFGSAQDIAQRLMAANPDLRRVQALRAAKSVVAESRFMADAVEESFQNIVNIARFFRLPESRIQRLMQPWVAGELTSSSASYNWWRQTWESIIDDSPRLAAAGKQELRRMWQSLVNDRSPGLIRTSGGAGDFANYEPTWFRTQIDQSTGEAIRMPVPVFEADQFQTWRIPDMRSLHEYVSRTQRTLREWRAAGGWARRAYSGAHLGMAQLWAGWNGLWKATTLLLRMPGALPLRIGGEQMLRIAALDHASLVRHPAEWFASTGIGTRMASFSDFALFADSPTHALGVAVDGMEASTGLRLARTAREEVTILDGAPFYRAYADRLGRIYASRSTHQYLMPYLDDPDQALASLLRRDEGRQWLSVADNTDHSPVEAVTRAQEEIRQLIGSGPGAELVRVALRRGATQIDGETVSVATSNFADALERMAARGDWTPGASRLNRSTGDYLPTQRVAGLKNVRDMMFRTFYSAPDLAASRSPLFRQMAVREYRNLIRRGYSLENALSAARAYAARGTADLLFTIGARTPGEHFLRNFMPFFPAFRELGRTWLLRVPQHLGSGNWALGASALARRADIWTQFFQDLGVIRTDERGQPTVGIPFLDGIVRTMTGTNATFDVRAPLETFAGVLPVPLGLLEKDEQGQPLPWYQRLKGLIPTLGGPSTFALGLTNDIFKDGLKDVENWLTLYGTDSSMGPLAVDRFFEAFGIVLPWMTATTREYHQTVRTWAVVDGMRIAWQEMGPPPERPDYDEDDDGVLTPDEDAAFNRDSQEYAENLMESGEQYATGTYLLRGIAGMILPFSIQIADEGKIRMAAMWSFIDSLPRDEQGNFMSPMIQSVLSEYPELSSYLTGKTQDTRLVDDPDETLDEFMQAVKDGEIQIRSAQDWAVFAMGMNAYSVFQSRVDAIYEEAGLAGQPASTTRDPVGVYVVGDHPNITRAAEEAVRLWNDSVGATVLELVAPGTPGAVPIRSAQDNPEWTYPPDSEAEFTEGEIRGNRAGLTDMINLTLAHEMGHALGLEHPQRTSTAEEYLPVDFGDPSTWTRVAGVGLMGNELNANRPFFRGLGPSAGEIEYLRELVGFQPAQDARPPTPAEWLTNFDAKDAVTQEKLAWQDFLDYSTVVDNFLPGQLQSFMDMFNTYDGYRRIRDGDSPRLSIQQQQLLDFDLAMREYAKFFSPNRESSDDYFKLREEAYAALGSAGQGEIAQGVSWWFDNVSDPYYTARDKLYDKLDKTNDRDKALVYQEIRNLADEYNKPWVHDQYGDFPTPEEYLFAKLSEEDQSRQVAEWANLPGHFLTEFQREQVGYSIPEGKQDDANKLANLVTKGDHAFNKAVIQANLSFSSTQVKDVRAALDAYYAQRADKLGLSAYWREMNAPEYRRIGDALNLGTRTPVWNRISNNADQLRAAIEAEGYSPGGTSDMAVSAHKWFVNNVKTARRNDRELDTILNELSEYLAEEGQTLSEDDLILKLFFGVFSTSQAYYLD